MLKKLSNGYYMGSATPASGGGTTINNLDVTVNPSVTEQTLTVPEGYTGYGTITANPVTASIDNNIVAGNIKDGVTILGVEGTLQSSETKQAVNLSGSSITSGDKVYLKKQTAQQESRVEKTNLNSQAILINPAGSKIISPSFVYDISTDTKTTVSGTTPNNYRVIKYKGQYIFCGQNVFGDGVSTSPFTWYAQGNYGVTDPGDYTGFIVRKYDDTLSNILQEWSVSFLAYNMCEWCVVKNHIYAISFRDSAYKLFEGTIDENSQTISMTQAQVVSQSDITASRYPAQTTIDDKIGIFANAKQGISLTRMNDDGSISAQFLSNNTDLSGIILSGVGTVFNKYTGILTSETISSDGNGGYSATAYIFKYNPATVDFDTVSIISNIPSSSNYSSSYDGYYTTSVSNDLSRMVVNTYQMQTHLLNLAVAEGGYNAVPYSMGQDIMTGTASDNALPNATFNVLVNAYDKLIDKKKYNITIDSIVGDVNENGVLQVPSGSTDLIFTGVKEVARGALSYRFYGGKITSASFPDLISINNNLSMDYIFSLNPNLTKVLFPELLEINSNNPYMIQACPLLNEVSFSKLITIGSSANLGYLCMNSTALEEISFPVLKNFLARYAMSYAFSGTNLSNVYFTSLDNINGDNVFYGMFHGAQKITNIYFNSLKTTSFGSYVSQFNNMFNSYTGYTPGAFTMHFPSNLESTIQGLTGYPDFGATSGRLTLAFDLPATE